VAQSVWEGCLPGATPSIQTRHMPALGIWPGGILPEFPLPCALSGDATANATSPAAIINDFILESSEKIAPPGYCDGGDLESS
jgi:hypothetical protein